MSRQLKSGLGAGALVLIVLVGLWAFWGSSALEDRQQDEVLSELTAVVEENSATTDAPSTSAPTTATSNSDTSTTTSTETTTSSATATTTETTTSSAAATTGTAPTSSSTSSSSTSSSSTSSSSTSSSSTSSSSTQAPDRTTPTVASFTIVETIPHDTGAFTQGLEIWNGRLFESTGLVGRSSIRELDLQTGAVIRNTPVPDVFGEGLTIVDTTAIQITWQDEVAFRYDLDTFEVLETFSYDGQGWGLCHADEGSGNLIMSDGSSELDFRDPDTFELLGSVDVRLDGTPIVNLNELECIGDTVWANIWLSSLIIEIDPATGNVLTVLDADSLRPESTADDSGAVWNGLAYDPADGTLLVTGKLWPTIFRLELSTN